MRERYDLLEQSGRVRTIAHHVDVVVVHGRGEDLECHR